MGRFHSQNLNEDRTGKVIGWKLWHGRAWWQLVRPIHWEWSFGKKSTSFHFKVNLRDGDGDDGILLIMGIPFLFDLYFGIDGVLKSGKETTWGVAIHNSAFWVYPGNLANKSSSDDPWYRRNWSWYFPWSLDWHSTDILKETHLTRESVWREESGQKKDWEERKSAEKTASVTWPYAYQLENGTVQHVDAQTHIMRMEWRARWWPIIWRRKISTSISANFSSEVGEGTGSWKGGTVGCGFEMLPGETLRECLQRMERERKFDR